MVLVLGWCCWAEGECTGREDGAEHQAELGKRHSLDTCVD